MISNVITDKEWITLKDASKKTGRSIQALRLLINRKKIDKVRKMQDNGPGYWEIHKDALPQISIDKVADKDTSQTILSGNSQASYQVITIPAEVYERQQKEHDNMVQGIMMYRYKYEELERKVKLLPAPVETVSARIEELEQQARTLRAELEQARRPWWKKLWRK